VSGSDQAMGKQRCLIANDETMQLKVLEFLFLNLGIDVITAQNGH